MAGRPRGSESKARTRELLRLLVGGATLADAAKQARVKPDRVLTLLDEPDFYAVYQAVRDGASGPVAVTLAPTLDIAA